MNIGRFYSDIGSFRRHQCRQMQILASTVARVLVGLFALTVLVLNGCAAPSRQAVSVSPGQLFAGSYINVTAPASDGWYLAQSSPSGMAFAKHGQAVNETFAAQVAMFNLAPTKTPEEFEVLIKNAVQKDTDPNRFNVQQVSFKYTSERSYPCVRYHSVTQDMTPQGSKGPLLLEMDALYCRHPVRQETGFAAIYSRRGEGPYANLRSEAEKFIQGIQVPSK